MPTHFDHAASPPRRKRTRWLMLSLSAAAISAELTAWVLTDSLAMLAGAAHVLVDLATGLAPWSPSGGKCVPDAVARRRDVRQTMLLGILACLLTYVFFQVMMRGPHRLLHPTDVDGVLLVLIAPIGLVASLACASVWVRAGQTSMLSDAAQTLGLVTAIILCAAAVALMATGYDRLDTMVAIFVSFILLGRLLVYSLRN